MQHFKPAWHRDIFSSYCQLVMISVQRRKTAKSPAQLLSPLQPFFKLYYSVSSCLGCHFVSPEYLRSCLYFLNRVQSIKALEITHGN